MSDLPVDDSPVDDSIDVGYLPIGITSDEIRSVVEWIERGALAQEAIELVTQECICFTVGLKTHLCSRQ